MANKPLTKEAWTNEMTIELGNIAQGNKVTNTPGTNNVFFLDHTAIKNIPTNRKLTYACIVVDYGPQKPDPNSVRITVDGNLIEYPHEVTTQTADLVTNKILWKIIAVITSMQSMIVLI